MIEKRENAGAMLPKQNDPEPPQFTVGDDLYKFLMDLWERCEKADEDEWRKAKSQMLRCRKYFDGDQFGTVNNKLEWVDVRPRPGEVTYQDNQYAPHVLTAHMELMRGDTKLTFEHAAKESRRGELIAKIAEARYRIHRQRLFTAAKMDQENMSLLLNGVALRYTFTKWQTSKEQFPVFEEAESDGDSATVCAQCGAPQKGEECPKCGNKEFETLHASFKTKKIAGYEKDKRAKNDWHSPDPMGITFDIHAPTLHDSAYLIWKQAVSTSVLQATFQKSQIEGGIKSQELLDSYGQSGQTPNSGGFRGTGDRKNTTEFAQGWFDPSLYAHYRLTSPVTLRNGKTIPQGTLLGDALPDGLYLAKIGDRFEDIQNEAKCDKWTCAPYITRLGTMLGLGTSIVLDGQDRLNDIINLQQISILNDSFRREFVNSQYLSPDEIPNNPGERAFISSMPDGMNIMGGVIGVMPPSSLSSDAYAVPESIKGSMQNQLGTFSSSASGMPDLKAAQNTASGMQLFRELTVGRFYPMLKRRADSLDREQAYQLLCNDQKNMTAKEWEMFAGDYGHEAVEAFRACDLREELLINVVDESFMPQTPSQKLSKTVEYYGFAAQTAGMLSQEATAHVAEQFGMPAHIVGFNAAYSMAMEQVEALSSMSRAIAQQVGDVPTYDLNNPQTLAAAGFVIEQVGIPIVPELDDTVACIEAIRDYWQTDAGRSAPNLLKAVLVMRVEQLKTAAAEGTRDDALLAKAIAQPLEEADAAEQEAAMAAQSEQQQQAAAQQMEAEAMRMEAEIANVEKDREFQAAMKAADFAESERQRQHDARQARMNELGLRG